MKTLESKNTVSCKTNIQPDPTYFLGQDVTPEIDRLLDKNVFDRVFVVANGLFFDLRGQEIPNNFKKTRLSSETRTIKDAENDKTSTKWLTRLADQLNKFLNFK